MASSISAAKRRRAGPLLSSNMFQPNSQQVCSNVPQSRRVQANTNQSNVHHSNSHQSNVHQSSSNNDSQNIQQSAVPRPMSFQQIVSLIDSRLLLVGLFLFF